MQNAAQILRESQLSIAAETYSLISMRHEDFARLLENAELSPRMSAPFSIFMDKHEVTLMLDDVDFETMRHALREAKIERGFRLLTFETELDLNVIGFLAEVARILADSSIPILAMSAFSRDHILVKQLDLANALKALGPYVHELC
ncbi:MAG: ACT domain-containing protein [Pyrinomonadaceae bacterium]